MYTLHYKLPRILILFSYLVLLATLWIEATALYFTFEVVGASVDLCSVLPNPQVPVSLEDLGIQENGGIDFVREH